MAKVWTASQVLSLSPDAGSTRRGKSLATLSKWSMLAQTKRAIWGECKGSGKNPYRTAIDLAVDEPAFRCSCPSRKFPCKHALGLFLLWTQAGTYSQGDPPEWVAKWLQKRDKNTQRIIQKATQSHAQSRGQSQQEDLSKTVSETGAVAADVAVDMAAIAKKIQQTQQRQAKRIENVSEGVIDLEQWLQDIIRAGLADLPNQPYRFWDQTAARLVDVQAPGLARRVKALSAIPLSGKGWPERMLKALGSLYLLCQSFKQLESLSPMMQAEVLRQVGLPQNKEELHRRAAAGDSFVSSTTDIWHVLGRVVIEEDVLKVQRVWLWSVSSQKAALILSFAHGRRQPLDTSLMPGDSFEGRLLFYPGTGVQRALVVSKTEAAHQSRLKSRLSIGVERVEAAIAHYAQALSENPWLAEFPIVLSKVWLHHHSGTWYLRDAEHKRLPISPFFTEGWEMLAMSGGRSLCVFGEWNGELFSPLSAWTEKTFVTLGGR